MARRTEYTEEDAIKLISGYLEIKMKSNKTPYIEEFATTVMNCDDETVLEYAKRWPEFSATLKMLKTFQKFRLLEGEGSMAIFQLKANHGMIETERKMLVGKEGESLGVVVLPETK